MTKSLEKCDKVSWNTSQGRTHGTVVKKQTSETHIKGHRCRRARTTPSSS